MHSMNYRLAKAMDRLRAESGKAEAPWEVERVVMAEFDRVKAEDRHAKRKLSRIVAAGAIAASVAAVLILEHRRAIESPTSSAAVFENVREPEQPFFPIPYVAPLGAYERAEIVRMEMPVAALIAAGLPMRTADLGAQAEAEVIVGQDGRARAVRLLSISTGTMR
jgi:hypothetical protein